MSRPPKMHNPLKGGFNNILAAVGAGKGVASPARKALPAQKKPLIAPVERPSKKEVK